MADVDPREALGRIVHEQRVALDAELAKRYGRQRFALGDWNDRTEDQRELDRRIGAAVEAAVMERFRAHLPAVLDALRLAVAHGPFSKRYRSALEALGGGEAQERTDEKGPGGG